MTPEELQSQLNRSGIVCRIQREEVLIETCYFCGNNRWNLELSAPRGLFHCWACDEGGRLDRLLREWLGQDTHIPVQHTRRQSQAQRTAPTTPFATTSMHTIPSASAYLARRGVTQDMIAAYNLTVCTDTKHLLYNRIIIPILDFWNGVNLGYVGRTYTNQYPKYLSTLSQRIVAGYRVRISNTACIIIEGIFDGMAVHQAGYHAAILLGTGTSRIQEFISRLPRATPIAVMLDGAAQAEAERLKWIIQAVHASPVQLINLPVHTDPANFAPQVLRRLLSQTLSRDLNNRKS